MINIGLYRHFKGEYYFVRELVKDCGTEQTYVIYFNVCHPEYGSFSRPLEDFMTHFEKDGRHIIDRPDNVTGQMCRFERVKDLNYQLGSVSTITLINELRGREDSPLHDIDIYGMNDLVDYRDYCIGVVYEATEKTPYGVNTENVFNTKEQASKYFHTHKHSSKAHIYKRVFVRIEE